MAELGGVPGVLGSRVSNAETAVLRKLNWVECLEFLENLEQQTVYHPIPTRQLFVRENQVIPRVPNLFPSNQLVNLILQILFWNGISRVEQTRLRNLPTVQQQRRKNMFSRFVPNRLFVFS
jgi:hypothetical protein